MLAAVALGGQLPRVSDRESHPLPKPTGAPLTIVPVDREEIECSIHEWNPNPPQPFLKLLCPPQSEFAPLRVYLKLSWLSSNDVPAELRQVRVTPHELTKIRTDGSSVLVRLMVWSDAGRTKRERWVGFNGVVDLALIKDRLN